MSLNPCCPLPCPPPICSPYSCPLQDLLLHMDGALEVKVHTTGYPQAAYWSITHGNRYGHPLHYNVSGTIHDHMLHWKVDLDISGPSSPRGSNNSVRLDEMKVEVTHDEE